MNGLSIMLDQFRDTSFQSNWTRHFGPDDLSIMRQAFKSACAERPKSFETEEQRLILAKAVVITYRPLCSERQLISEALDLAGQGDWKDHTTLRECLRFFRF